MFNSAFQIHLAAFVQCVANNRGGLLDKDQKRATKSSGDGMKGWMCNVQFCMPNSLGNT